MMIIKKLKYALVKLEGFIQYNYYVCAKNHYSCKLLGEKRSGDASSAIIIYRNLGESQLREIPIKELLATPSLVSRFHPKDALKIGSIALEEFIFELPKNIRKLQFGKIKYIMLNSTHDIVRSSKLDDSLLHNSFYEYYEYKESPNTDIPFLNQPIKNTYPFKLAGGKLNTQGTDTIITYTILGKREGYEKNLDEIVNNIELLEKFHPSEAIKFGFIILGDSLFQSSKTKKEATLNLASML